MDPFSSSSLRRPNTLQIWGNSTTMNLNTLILTNITNSPYFKGQLQELKTYHEVVDEIYYKVRHLEPWEKGSRRTAGQTGMCGGVRGVGAGGVISTAFCILYKLFGMRITRKQVVGLMNHGDSGYIRGLGFMYVRFTQPPADLWDWFESYIDDPEEVDVRAGGGQVITIGEMVRLFLTKLDWFGSLFPRIPVPIQIGIDRKLSELQHATSIDATPRNNSNNHNQQQEEQFQQQQQQGQQHGQGQEGSNGDSSSRRRKRHDDDDDTNSNGDGKRSTTTRRRSRSKSRSKSRSRSPSRDHHRSHHHHHHRRHKEGDSSSSSQSHSHRRQRHKDKHSRSRNHREERDRQRDSHRKY